MKTKTKNRIFCGLGLFILMLCAGNCFACPTTTTTTSTTTTTIVLPSIYSCGANASEVYKGDAIRLGMTAEEGTYGVKYVLFELNSAENYSYADYSGDYIWKDLDTSGMSGTYNLLCIIVDCQNNRVSLGGGSFTVKTPTTTTTTTSTSTTTTTTTSTTSTTTSTIKGIIIHARGKAAAGVLPRMQLWIDGVLKAQWDVLEVARDYVYETGLTSNGHDIDVVFTNDCWTPTVDRDLFVYYIEVNGMRMDPTDSGVKYDKGVGDAAFDGLDVIAGQVEMDWSGALRFEVDGGYVPTTSTTTTSTTTTTRACALKGDYSPCGEITLSEVVAYINKWSAGEAALKDVVALINAYQGPQ